MGLFVSPTVVKIKNGCKNYLCANNQNIANREVLSLF